MRIGSHDGTRGHAWPRVAFMWLYSCTKLSISDCHVNNIVMSESSCDAAPPPDPFAYRLSTVATQSGVTPFHDLHNREGLKFAQRKDWQRAEPHFRSAAFASSFGSRDWSNFALTLREQAMASGSWGAVELTLLRESLAAFDLSGWMGKPSSVKKDRAMIIELVKTHYPRSPCPADDCGGYQLMVRIVNARPLTAALVREFCTTETITATPGPDPTIRGFGSAQSFRRSWLALKVCGVVVLEGAVEAPLIREVAASQRTHLEQTLAEIRRRRPDVLDTATPFAPRESIQAEMDDAAERSKLRFEVRLPLTAPFTADGLTSSEALLSLVKAAMRSRRLELDTFSSVTALPGAPAQHWHSDVEALFGAGFVEEWQHELPPHAVVAAVALDTIPRASGPTEFKLGSHLASLRAAGANAGGSGGGGGGGDSKADALPRAAFAVPAGAAVLFDVRIEHRGGANTSPRPRSLLYMSYVHEWWHDALNFRGKQTRGWDVHNTSRGRKLFARLDAERWTRRLEEMLTERGVDLDAERSAYRPHPSTDLYV